MLFQQTGHSDKKMYLSTSCGLVYLLILADRATEVFLGIVVPVIMSDFRQQRKIYQVIFPIMLPLN